MGNGDAAAADTGINRRRCSACTCSRVRLVAAATELRTGCVMPRGNVRPCVRSHARMRTSGAFAVAESSSSSARRCSSECACSSAIRARKSVDSSPAIIWGWLCKVGFLRCGAGSVRARGRPCPPICAFVNVATYSHPQRDRNTQSDARRWKAGWLVSSFPSPIRRLHQQEYRNVFVESCRALGARGNGCSVPATTPRSSRSRE